MVTERRLVSRRSILSLRDLLARRMASSSKRATAHAIPAEAGTVPVSAGVDIDDNEGGVGLREWKTEFPGRGIKPLALLGAVSVVLPILPVLILLAIHLTYHPKPPNTGDPLLDRLLLVLQREYPVMRITDGSPLMFQPELVPGRALQKAVLASDERDPRRWLLLSTLSLRYPTKPDSHDLSREALLDRQELLNNHGKDRAIEYLETASAKGYVDAPLLYRLWDRKERRWFLEMDEETASQWRGHSSSDYAALTQTERAIIDKRHGAEEQRLLADLDAAAPADATPCYCKAQIAAQHGDYSEAIRQISLGNARPACVAFRAFPSDSIAEARRTGRPLLNPPATFGLETACGYYAWPLGVGRLDMLKYLLQTAAERGDAEGLEALRQCQWKTSTGGGCPSTLTSFEPAILKYWPRPLSGETQTALKAGTALEQQYYSIPGMTHDRFVYYGLHWPGMLSIVFAKSGLEAEGPARIQRLSAEAAFYWDQADQTRRAQQSAGALALRQQLEQFDYTKVLASSEPASGH